MAIDWRRKFAEVKLCREDSVPCVISGCDFLYIGSVGSACSPDILTSLGITHVLCVADGIDKSNILSQNGFICLYAGVRDDPETNIKAIFETCFSFIDEARINEGKVLVYCFQGKSRSATVCCAYLMRFKQLRFIQALDIIRETRIIAAPNLGFIVVLRKFEKDLFA